MNYDLLTSKYNIIFFKTADNTDILEIDCIYLKEILNELKNNELFKFDFLISLYAADFLIEQENISYFELNYVLYSELLNEKLIIRTKTDRDISKVQSVADIFKGAEFEEREIFDLFGIVFEGNSNLERILLPNDWIGYPLRKDYTMTDERLQWNGR